MHLLSAADGDEQRAVVGEAADEAVGGHHVKGLCGGKAIKKKYF